LDENERYKGIEEVLLVLPRLRGQFPDVRYVVVGEGSDRPRLEQLARELGVADVTEFTGHLPPGELALRYASCSVFVLPSTGEGFGIVFLEAMAHAKPVVAARSGGTPEVVVDGETGLLVEPGDGRALQAALTRLFADTDLRRQMGGTGRRRLEENFTFAHFRQRLTGLLVAELPQATYLARRRLFIKQALRSCP
ncbi:MAG: glycosyltransferase, partial [Terriglobia bacterium]